MALDKTLIYSGPISYISVGSEYIYYTLDGVTITCETDFMDTETDQQPGPINKRKIYQKFTIGCKVVHLTNALAKFAFAQPDGNISGNNLTVDNSARPAQTITVVLSNAVSGRTISLIFNACYALGASSVLFGPRQQAAWELRFETIYSSGYGTIAKTA